jgi:hypothetical protein
MKCIPAVNSVNKTNRNRYNSVLKISCKIFYCQLKQLLLLTLYIHYDYAHVIKVSEHFELLLN